MSVSNIIAELTQHQAEDQILLDANKTCSDKLVATLVATQTELVATQNNLAFTQVQLEAAKAQLKALTTQIEPVQHKPFLVGITMQTGSTALPAGLDAEAHRSYWTLPTGLASMKKTVLADIAAGMVPVLSFKVGSWTSAVAGSADASVIAARDWLKSLNVRVLVIIHHEPENDSASIQTWKKMQERFAPMFDTGLLEYGICLMGWYQFDPSLAKTYGIDMIWPAGPIMFCLLDVYQDYGTVSAGVTSTKWKDIEAYLKLLAPQIQAHGAYVGIGETGITDAAYLDGKDTAGFWNIWRTAADKYDLRVFCYFSSSLNSKGSWKLDGTSTPQILKAADYMKLLANS